MNLVKRWILGLMMILHLFIINILIQVVFFIVFAPSWIIYVYLKQKAGEGDLAPATLDATLLVLAIAYAVLIGPIAMTWVAKWKGLPIWGSLGWPTSDGAHEHGRKKALTPRTGRGR
jgi:hypothetical protein